jgi:hypothetical protein
VGQTTAPVGAAGQRRAKAKRKALIKLSAAPDGALSIRRSIRKGMAVTFIGPDKFIRTSRPAYETGYRSVLLCPKFYIVKLRKSMAKEIWFNFPHRTSSFLTSIYGVIGYQNMAGVACPA